MGCGGACEQDQGQKESQGKYGILHANRGAILPVVSSNGAVWHPCLSCISAWFVAGSGHSQLGKRVGAISALCIETCPSSPMDELHAGKRDLDTAGRPVQSCPGSCCGEPAVMIGASICDEAAMEPVLRNSADSIIAQGRLYVNTQPTQLCEL